MEVQTKHARIVKPEQHQEMEQEVVIIVDQVNIHRQIKLEVVQFVQQEHSQMELQMLVALIVQQENIKDQKGNHHVIHVE